MENFEYSITFEYKCFMKRKIYPICYIIENLLIYETVLFLVELKTHSRLLTSF